MTHERKITLARQLVSSPWWYWMPGMRDIGGARCESVRKGMPHAWVVDGSVVPAEHDEGSLPDPADPATLGCAEIVLLHDAWPDARITIDIDPWTVPTCVEIRICPAPGDPCRSFFGRGQFARAEALIAAIEAAPRPGPGNVDDTIAGRGDTEDDALVSALEAAPEVPG